MNQNEKKAKKVPALLRFFLYAVLGMLFALPIAFPKLWFLGWIAPIPVLYLETFSKSEKDSYLRSYGRGMIFFGFFGIVVFSWFTELYPLDFLGFEKSEAIGVVLIALLGLPLLQALSSALAFVFLRIVKKTGFADKHPILSSAFSACVFSLVEFYHTLFWFGVPWGKAAVGQVGCLANIQSASLFGSYFITFLMIFTSSLVAASLKSRQKRSKRVLLASLALFVFLANFTFGAIRCSVIDNRVYNNTVKVAAVQGNIKFESKWSNKTEYILGTYSTLSKDAADNGAELIIWPETAVPYDLYENPWIRDYFSECAEACEHEILATVFESEETSIYNTARLVNKDGTIDSTVYKKRHLVPFGEYIPLKEFISKVYPPLTQLSSVIDEITPGEDSAVIEVQNGRLGVLICFDSIYEDLCRDSVKNGSELIAVSTNDSWFSGSTALSQHNANSQLRAIENGRYVVRAANTGISSVISPAGELIESLGDGEKGYITADVHFIDDTTLYTKTGNAFLLISAVFVIAIICTAFLKNNHNRIGKRK